MERTEEKALIEASRRGDKRAFGKLIEANQMRLFRTVFLMLGSRDMAMDIMQDTFVKAWKALDRFDPECLFYPWLATIGRNLALNQIKRAGREESLDDLESQVAEIPDESSDPLDNLIAKESDRKFAAALGVLPEQFRAVFVLRMYERMSYKGIAEELGISPGTVDSRMSRAREKLMELLKAELE